MRRSLALTSLLLACTPVETPADTDAGTQTDTEGSGTTGAPSTGGGSGSTTSDSTSSPGSTTADDTTSGSTSEASISSATSTTGDESSSTTQGPDPSDCEALGLASDPIEVGADEAATRIHPFLVADGEGVWFAHAEREPVGSLFDVVVRRLSCDGSTWVEPQTVSALGSNDIDPSIAVVGSEVHVIWDADDGAGGDSNLQIAHRSLAFDGTPDEAPSIISTSVGGMAIEQNHTRSALTTAGTEWFVAGIRAHPSAAGFQAFAQPMQGGELGAEAWDGLNSDASHLGIALAGAPDGSVVIGHEEGTATDDFVRLRPLDAEASAGVRAFEDVPTVAPSLVADPAGGGLIAALADFGGELDVVVAHYTAELDVSDPLRLGVAGLADHSPQLVVDGRGNFAVVAHRNQGGLSNEVVFTSLRWNGETLSAGEERVLATQSPPYPPTAAAIGDQRFMVGWVQGRSPNFTTWIQVVDASDM